MRLINSFTAAFGDALVNHAIHLLADRHLHACCVATRAWTARAAMHALDDLPDRPSARFDAVTCASAKPKRRLRD